MYRRGDAQLVTEPPEWWDVMGDDSVYAVEDSRGGDSVVPPFVQLPHSCSAWIIGGPNELRVMIGDLRRLLNQITGEKT